MKQKQICTLAEGLKDQEVCMYRHAILLASYSVTENPGERPWQTVGIHQNGSGDR